MGQKESEKQELKRAISNREARWIKVAAELSGCHVFVDGIGSGLAYMKIKDFTHDELPLQLKKAIKDYLNPRSYEFYTATRLAEVEGKFPAVRLLVRLDKPI